jgi:hypothetical protein
MTDMAFASFWRLLKANTLVPVRERLNTLHRNHCFRRSLWGLSRDLKNVRTPRDWIIRDLIYGWGNDAWSATEDYLAACVKHALLTEGPILECGSGLTTIVLGIIGDIFKRQVWTLEHDSEWGGRVGTSLKNYRIKSVQLCVHDLKQFRECFWYDAPIDQMPEFSMVVCDGPPAKTPGGRYGLLPAMKGKLKAGALILLDDAERAEERDIAERWCAELNTNYQILGTQHPYILLTVPEIMSRPAPLLR